MKDKSGFRLSVGDFVVFPHCASRGSAGLLYAKVTKARDDGVTVVAARRRWSGELILLRPQGLSAKRYSDRVLWVDSCQLDSESRALLDTVSA